MKPFLLKMPSNAAHAISARVDTTPYVNNLWHYHAELELIYVKKGAGTQFIGDDIRAFGAGDIVLLGSSSSALLAACYQVPPRWQ